MNYHSRTSFKNAVLSSVLFAAVACDSIPERANDTASTSLQLANTALTPPRPAAAAQKDVAQRDVPAKQYVDFVRDAFRQGRQSELSFAVYSIVTPPRNDSSQLVNRARALGVLAAAEVSTNNAGRLEVTLGTHRIARNENSGAELFVEDQRFHQGNGVARNQLRPEAEYIAAARSHLAKAFPALGANYYPYKVRTYMNGDAEADDAVPVERAYQITVAYNATIDDVPAIGSGGKVGVYMTPKGEVVGHHSIIRSIGARVGTVKGSSLLSPDSARALAEARLTQRGVQLDQYTLSREEFGYMVRGRNSAQTVVAPHYAYFYEPKDGVTGRRRVETIPATDDPGILGLLRRDDESERSRKDWRAHLDTPPDVRK
jgi:hypothetical protein